MHQITISLICYADGHVRAFLEVRNVYSTSLSHLVLINNRVFVYTKNEFTMSPGAKIYEIVSPKFFLINVFFFFTKSSSTQFLLVSLVDF